MCLVVHDGYLDDDAGIQNTLYFQVRSIFSKKGHLLSFGIQGIFENIFQSYV